MYLPSKGKARVNSTQTLNFFVAFYTDNFFDAKLVRYKTSCENLKIYIFMLGLETNNPVGEIDLLRENVQINRKYTHKRTE